MVTCMSPLKCMKKGFKLIITNILHKNINESEISNLCAGDRFLHLPAIQYDIRSKYLLKKTLRYCKRMLKTPLNFITRYPHECPNSRLVKSKIFGI